MSRARKGIKLSEEHKANISLSSVGRVVSPETRKKISDALYKGGKKKSQCVDCGISLSNPTALRCKKDAGSFRFKNPEERLKQSRRLLGEKSPNWQGGKTNESLRIRHSIEYRLWREAVFARDNWTCVLCSERGCVLNADHIKSFALHPDLRFAIDNGRTLCVPCHKKTDTYGNKSRKRKV